MQRVPRGLVHVAAELRSRARCNPAAAAWRTGSAQLPALSTHARSCVRATCLASEQRGTFLQASTVPPAVSAHEEVSGASVAASGAHTQAPAAVLGALGLEDRGDAPHTPVLLREVISQRPSTLR